MFFRLLRRLIRNHSVGVFVFLFAFSSLTNSILKFILWPDLICTKAVYQNKWRQLHTLYRDTKHDYQSYILFA